MKNLREMLGKRAELVTQARAIDERAEKESRKLSAEETTNFDKAIADADAIGVEIEREQKLMALEKRAIENVAEAERASHRPGSDSPEAQNASRAAAFVRRLDIMSVRTQRMITSQRAESPSGIKGN